MKLLTDADVYRFPVAQAVKSMRTALLLHASGHLTAPPRLRAAGLTFTVGETPDAFGFRAYPNVETPLEEQLVAVWNAQGQVEGVIVGSALGPLRTSALGAVATDVLSRPEASRLGLIGSGIQAKAHALAVATVRPLSRILIYSRDAVHREKLAAELMALGLPAKATASAEQVCTESELLTLATSSAKPVIRAEWVRPGTHVCTLGPKEKERHEFPPELAERCALIVTDSPAQLGALSGAAVRALGGYVQNPPSRRPEDITLFLSVGLAGTEVVLAQELLRFAQP
ncbi:ornithine cyclodeaminase family protein [Deinococcus detaillensis]|uniref:Ornithine cyclodeaminase family protein n=1 Tax=Deinococcus detaillensis TaxID=2592048 RepID=A0A553UQD5_9DEIO|nr:ornithine cyclodeaminase family protein [Deinococcus detaillensis]TSA82427.1 ornithine cyclodeaminase family protein [Deinococcus detaillensis]